MKQGNIYIKTILWLCFAAVVCYFGFYVANFGSDGVRTVAAMEYEAGSGTYTEGYVVRSEEYVKSNHPITTLLVTEAERVAYDQHLATGYRDSAAQDRQARVTALQHEAEQLEYAAVYSTDAADQAALESEIETNLTDLCRFVARRDMNSAAERSAPVKGLILRQTSSKEEANAMTQRAQQIDAELAMLREQSAEDTRPITAPAAGYFSGSVDGFEQVLTPEGLEDMTAEKLESLRPAEVDGSVCCKIITSDTWYYVTAVPSEAVNDVRIGDRVPVSFVSAMFHDLPMTVSRLGEEENGKRLIVLSCDRYMQDVTLLRRQSADLVFSSYSGLRVPKETVRVTEDRRTGVYVLEAGYAVWKYVELLHDNGGTYVVKLDKSSTENLWPGDEIILGEKDLFDGKVMQQ